MKKRIPLALSRPEPAETDEEFVARFATEVMASLQAYRSQRSAENPGEDPQES